MRRSSAITAALVCAALGAGARQGSLLAQEAAHVAPDPYDSGGPLIREQAAYDVTFYDLALAVHPSDSTLRGAVEMVARVVVPTDEIAFDLDTLLAVKKVTLTGLEGDVSLRFERAGGRVWVRLPYTVQPGEELSIGVAYGGRPRIAPHPPWDGGFTWAATRDGEPWIATSNQMNGADLWWPNKDHVSDKPDSVRLHITVPRPLVVASNGRLTEVENHVDGTRTYHWFVSTPISAYNVALNIAPYLTLEAEYESVAGDTMDVIFYALPESYEQAKEFFPRILEHLRWFERTLGPYPFRADKYGVAETPHLGMEHQSIIAYGADFDNGAMTLGVDWGFDALHHHELSHEWWGNLVTNADWKDMWIHEGFGTYMQALYLEDTQGIDRYHAYMQSLRWMITNRRPTAPRRSLSARETYGLDIYAKGAWVLHTLRYLIGTEGVRTLLRRMAYPSPEAARAIDGRQVRFATTSDVARLAGEIAGRDLDWFFEVYLRQAELPRLAAEVSAGPQSRALALRWDVPGGLPFPMPVEVRLGERIERIDMSGGQARILIPDGVQPVIDPDGWILRARGGGTASR